VCATSSRYTQKLLSDESDTAQYFAFVGAFEEIDKIAPDADADSSLAHHHLRPKYLGARVGTASSCVTLLGTALPSLALRKPPYPA
jgi:hypothetical protein